MTERSVLFACDLDSQVFGALPLARAFAARGWRASFALDPSRSLPPALGEQLAGRFEVVAKPVAELPTDPEAFRHDAIGVFVTGSRLALFRHALELAARIREGRRPALFCGFNGLVFEKFEEGVAWRLGYDVVCLNGPRDRDVFVDFLQGSDFADQPYTVVGLRRRPDAAPRSAKPEPVEGERKLFVFAEQVVVPRGQRERQALVAALIRLAEASPQWDVVIKARVRPGEQTFHQQSAHIQTLVDWAPRKPANLSVSYEPLDALLERADLFATISSTALFDAFDFGVPSLIATDFGLRNADGTHVFFSSGLGVRLDELGSLDDAPRLAPDERWLSRVGYGPDASPAGLIEGLKAFDRSTALPRAFVSFPAAVQTATDSVASAREVVTAWEAVRAAMPESGFAGGDERLDAERALASFGALLTRKLVIADGAPDPEANEGAVAGFSRKLGMYWLYKRIRLKLGLPVG